MILDFHVGPVSMLLYRNNAMAVITAAVSRGKAEL